MQTGTLGYLPEWTINFDDKVKPEALLAPARQSVSPDLQKNPTDCLLYCAVDWKLWCIANWVGIANWRNRASIDSHF